jgi:hypothetical protein
MISLQQAKNLKQGEILYHVKNKNADGTPQRWKLTSNPKTWKRTPGKIRIKVKFGLYHYDTITENDLHLVSMKEDFFILKMKEKIEKHEMQKM